MRVRTRIAPSPTGADLHIGNVYTALFNYVFAQKNKGDFIVRIEDTDRTRFVGGAEEKMLASLKWAGIKYQEGPDIGGPHGPYRQSERLPIYKKHAELLIAKSIAYYCFCTPQRLTQLREEQQQKKLPVMYDGLCKHIPREKSLARSKNEPYVIRLNVPDTGETIFSDMIRGKIHFENKLIDDQVLLKSDGFPTYHLAVVIDDHLMEVSHVIRGEDWISSTPKHVMLYWAFGWNLPYFAHLPLLRNPDKSRFSKRKNPVWTSWYREQGFLPEALLNYLGTMTWGMPDGRDIFSLSEMIAEFDIKDIKTTAPIFNIEKLTWLNGEYIRLLSDKALLEKVLPYVDPAINKKLLSKLVPLAKARMKKLTEMQHYVKPFVSFTKAILDDKQKPAIVPFIPLFDSISTWKTQDLETAAKKQAEAAKLSLHLAFMALRLAITGEKIGLPLFETMEILGKSEVMHRLKSA